MRLSPEDVDLFYKLYPPLLFFANARHGIEDISTVDQLMSLAAERRLAIREILFANDHLIDEFVSSNPAGLNQQELAIVAGWKSYLEGRFYLLRQLKRHAIFLSAEGEPKAYGVLAIADLFDEIVPFMPIIVGTVSLPFKGQIIYDGLLSTHSITFGGGIKRRMNETYNEAKAKYGIITSLENVSEIIKELDEAEWLKYYLRSAKNQEEYWDEIQYLIRKSEENETIFFQEIGKYFAKDFGKRLRHLGIENGCFGIMESVIIGSGKTRKEAEKNIAEIIPRKKMPHVYFFQLKPKRSSRK